MVTVALLTRWNNEACSEARLGLGCVSAKPIRVGEFEEIIRGKSATELVAKADELALLAARSCEPLADLWGSTEYKKQVVKNLVKRAVQDQCRGNARDE